MKYRYSAIDRSNLKWFPADNSVQTLREIELKVGELRGLKPFELEFLYPLSVILGVNGSGKSTLLSMAACAFHGATNGFRMHDRKTTYYTFSDFFVQANDEVPPAGIQIYYGINNDRWNKRDPGLGYQIRSKNRNGKWNNYNRRVRRNVAFLGIQRIVPDSESSTHRTYRKYFSPQPHKHAKSICEIASKIFKRQYSQFEICKLPQRYMLPKVESEGVRYSGFNMGAGEKAVFLLLQTIFDVGVGGLIIIDELELGLHASAQKELVFALKALCLELHCQIICSSHSPSIIEAIPPEGRFLIEKDGAKTKIKKNVGVAYAVGHLAHRNTGELQIFCEDEKSEQIIRNILPHDLRERVSLVYIGSSEAVVRQLAAHYKARAGHDVLAVLDGDKKSEFSGFLKRFNDYLESPAAPDQSKVWASKRIRFLPSPHWPEKVILDSVLANEKSIKDLEMLWQCANVDAKIRESFLAGRHNEFYELSQSVHLDEQRVFSDVVTTCLNQSDIFKALLDDIRAQLEDPLF